NRRRSHKAVGVERDREVVAIAPALQEVPEVSSLEAGVDLAAAIGDGEPALPIGAECCELLVFKRRDFGLARIAQHIEMEFAGDTRGIDLPHHGVEVADYASRRLVAHEHGDGG